MRGSSTPAAAGAQLGNTTKAWRAVLRSLDLQEPVEPLDLNIEELHPFAVEWYDALRTYPVATLWSPMDWELARYAAYLFHLSWIHPWDTNYFLAFLQASNALIITEMSRRRAQIQLRMPAEDRGEDLEPEDQSPDPKIEGEEVPDYGARVSTAA